MYNVNRLRQAYFALKRNAAPGIDEITWHGYGEALEENLQDLSTRLQRGSYKARPVKRVYIPKPDGRERPVGVTVLEDKIVQRATVEVLNAVYEEEFLGFSYGFRPGRNQHNALDAVTVGIERRKIGWVLDADIQGFFDTIDHDWMMRFIEHRIADRRVHRHIKKWLNAGVLERPNVARQRGRHTARRGYITATGQHLPPLRARPVGAPVEEEEGTRRKSSSCAMQTTSSSGFQHKDDAERFQAELRERLAKFSLTLHPDKTRLIEFGRFADTNRRGRGGGKPESFQLLGDLTHICGEDASGERSACCARPWPIRLRAKLGELSQEMRKRMHHSIRETGLWLQAVLRGHYQYYGVPTQWPRPDGLPSPSGTSLATDAAAA